MWAVCLVTRPASRPSRLSLILHSIHSCRRRDVGEAKVREVEGGRHEGTGRYTSLTPLVPRAVSVPSPTSLRSGSLRSLPYATFPFLPRSFPHPPLVTPPSSLGFPSGGGCDRRELTTRGTGHDRGTRTVIHSASRLIHSRSFPVLITRLGLSSLTSFGTEWNGAWT